jgi:hypothetical protein
MYCSQSSYFVFTYRFFFEEAGLAMCARDDVKT